MMDDFLFGAATSAYQIEGAWDEDGKASSIWDELSHKKGYVLNGDTGDVACDHYHEWKSDVALMKKLGLKAYRFSISWSRIMTGPRTINNKGIDFYRNLVDELLKNDIIPFVTLFHWDLPKWLDDLGGWDNPTCVDEFVRYAVLMFDRLPMVRHWITFNEPAVFTANHWGLTEKEKAVKNIFLAHGRTVQLLKKLDKTRKIGMTLNLFPYLYDEDDDARSIGELHSNWYWLDPLFTGDFPKLWRKTFSLTRVEKKIIGNPGDFLGINYYSAGASEYNVRDEIKGIDDMGVKIVPAGIYEIMKRVVSRYDLGIPLYITESGCAYSDAVTHDGQVHDTRRIEYIRDHLRYVKKAVDEGVDVRGYFYWSLFDNFEWTFGYTKRFGLIHVHYPTLQRIPKDSFYWYHKIIHDEEFREEELNVEDTCKERDV